MQGRRELSTSNESYSIYSGNTTISIPNTCLISKLKSASMPSKRVSHLSVNSLFLQSGEDLKESKLEEKWLPHADAPIISAYIEGCIRQWDPFPVLTLLIPCPSRPVHLLPT